jgi:hypothetical protein
LKRAGEQVVEARALALTLRDRPTGHYPVTYPADSFTLRNPHLIKTYSVSDLLEYEAAFAVVVDRSPNRAVRAAHAALNVARSVGDEPNPSAQYLRATCRGRAARIVHQTLAWSEPTEGLAELQAALLAEEEEPVLLYLMRGHRANLHRLFSGLEAERFAYRDMFAEIGVREPTVARPAMFRAYRPLLPGDHAEALRRLNAGVAVARLPVHEQFAASRALRDHDHSEDVRYPITNFFVRTLESSVTSVLTSRAELVTAAVAIACERFRQKNGRWPRALDEIPKSVLSAVPTSPFDGQPLRYRVYDNRVAIFCRLAHETLRWNEPPEFEDLDAPPGIAFGVRLWNPDSRAQPPKPPDPPPADPE